MISKTENIDCIKAMKKFPDNFFELAIVDIPYGIGSNWKKDRKSKFYNHENSFNDSIPGPDYFTELFRVSKNQIIFGANYCWQYLTPSNNLIFWDKGKDALTQFGSEGELAWTSIKRYPFRKVSILWNGFCRNEKTVKIHPHQKPIKLYTWILKYYTQKGDKILDTHLGSGSSRIAAHSMGFDFYGYELDKNYFQAQEKRFQEYVAQKTFEFET